jgi:NAD(P)-dependent dehydrogenase (short-subunit alcohol dehydrogenase family)
MGRVANKVALVAGIGRAIALRLAEEGAHLVIGDIEPNGLEETATKIKALGGQVCSCVGDLTDSDAAASFINNAINQFGHIDILVNNIGGVGNIERTAKIWNMKVEDWDFILNLNLKPTFLCTRFAIPHMMERCEGKIVCISSGARNGTPWVADTLGGAAYSTAKAGLHGFIRDLSLELADYNIKVNAVAPGPVNTEIAGDGLRQLDKITKVGPTLLTPLHRFGEPEEIANAVLFLASDEASYITGLTMDVTGGR